MGLLDGKTALVTGASRGIGRAIALRFAREGADVAVTVRNSSDANAVSLLEELVAFGHDARVYEADARSFEGSHTVVEQVIADFGKIDILVNNAGMVSDSLVLRMSETAWDSVIENNLKSVFNYVHAVMPVMSRQRSGSIVSLSSVVGESGNVGQANYAAAKAGIIGLTKTVSKEMATRGIRANCIAPGFIVTDMTDALPDEVRRYWLDSTPMKRGGTPEEVASVAVFLASDMASFVNGQVIDVCGGLHC